jgi:hypothetical protein
MCHHFAFGGKRQGHHFFSSLTPLKATSTLLSKPLKKTLKSSGSTGNLSPLT